MTDKERLEMIKGIQKRIKECQEKGQNVSNLHSDYVDWLIQQAELMQRFVKKNAELNVFLNKYIKPKHLGKNVIDVAMDIIEKQSERVQELEGELAYYKMATESYLDMEQQNKRYREALETIEMVTEFKSEANVIANEVLEGE